MSVETTLASATTAVETALTTAATEILRWILMPPKRVRRLILQARIYEIERCLEVSNAQPYGSFILKKRLAALQEKLSTP